MNNNPSTAKKGLFVTAIQQKTGKTLFTAALARMLCGSDLNVGVMKPVETGVEDPAKLGADGALLRWAADSRQADTLVSPYRFRAQLAPAVAAAEEKQRIDYNALVEQTTEVIAAHDFTLVEGTGGLMTPLAGGLLMADYARAVGLPVLLLCRPSPDALDLMLTALYAAHALELEVAGYLITQMPEPKAPVATTLAHSLAVQTADELVGVLSQVSGGSEREKIIALEKQLAQLKTLSLLAPYLP